MKSPGCEFGLELVAVLPHLYHLSLGGGGAVETHSHRGTAPLYYFSARHGEDEEGRRYIALEEPYEIRSLHQAILSPAAWTPPPYKERYRCEGSALVQRLGLRLPLVVVHNKVADEWGRGPIHSLSPATLRLLCGSGHHVVYVRPRGDEEGYVCDGNAIIEGDGDHELVRACGGTVIQDVDVEYNRAQLLLSACSDLFVSVQGGAAILGSYFGGTNLVFAKEGVEVRRGLYTGFLRRLSGCEILPYDSEAGLLSEFFARTS